jgi:hypothetical protein
MSLGKPAKIVVKPLWIFSALTKVMKLFHGNNYAVFRFLEYSWKTPFMVGDTCGWRKLSDHFETLAKDRKFNTGSTASGL